MQEVNDLKIFFQGKHKNNPFKLTLQEQIKRIESSFEHFGWDPFECSSDTERRMKRYEDGREELQTLTKEELQNLRETLLGRKRQSVRNLFDSMEALHEEQENFYRVVPPEAFGDFQSLTIEERKKLKETLLEQKKQELKRIFDSMEVFYREDPVSDQPVPPHVFLELLNRMTKEQPDVNRKKITPLEEVFQKRKS